MDVFISVSEARQRTLEEAGTPVPAWQRIRALIDTGATITCIDPVVLIDALSLTPTGNTVIFTPSTSNQPVSKDLYDVGLWVPPGREGEREFWLIVRNMAVICTDLLQAMGYHALIGRDVLEKCLFFYDGASQRFTLAY